MNRLEKVSLLRSLADGQASLNILKRKQLKMLVNYNPPIHASYFIDEVEVTEHAYNKELSKQREQKDFHVQIGLILENTSSIRWL